MADWAELSDDSSSSGSEVKNAEETMLEEDGRAHTTGQQDVDEPMASSAAQLHINNDEAVSAHDAGLESAIGSSSTSPPMNIPQQWNQSIAMPHRGLEATSPSRILGGEGLLTPLNDAGPFVFDGSAGRASGRALAESLNAAGA
jgi:hypothetical protein